LALSAAISAVGDRQALPNRKDCNHVPAGAQLSGGFMGSLFDFIRDRPPSTQPVPGHDSVFFAPDSQWHQSELDGAFDIGPLSVIGELDPKGEHGILKEVLGEFGKSLEPLLALLERHRSEGNAPGIRFECRRLGIAAAHMGATNLATACAGITDYFEDRQRRSSLGKLDSLVDAVMTEAVRVQRKVRQLMMATESGP
jgi:hypothetical protein